MKTADSEVPRKLGDSKPPYIYWIAPPALGSLKKATDGLEFGLWQIDARTMKDRTTICEALGRMFHFSEYLGTEKWGRNWSALVDGLRGLNEVFPNKGYVLVVENADELWRRDPSLYYRFTDVMRSVSKEWDEWKHARISLKTVLVCEDADLRRVVTYQLT